MSVPPPPGGVPSMPLGKPVEKTTSQPKRNLQKSSLSLSEAKTHPLDIPIDWSNIQNVFLSSNQTSGILFVETQEKDHVVVVKATSTIAQEIYGGKIAEFLGLKTPQVKLMEYRADFKNPIKKYWADCKKYLKEFTVKYGMSVEQRKIEKELFRAFFLLMEFIEGATSLDDIMSDESIGKSLLENEQVCEDFGGMIVLDIILNNCDRLPLDLIWNHEGNSSNILFSPKLQRIVLIDQAFMAIINEGQKQTYFKKIESFSKCCSAETLSNNPYLDQVVDYIYNCTGYKMSDQAKENIHKGILKSIEKLKSLNKETLQGFKTEVEMMKTGSDWESTYFNSVLTIDIDFLYEAIQKMTNIQ